MFCEKPPLAVFLCAAFFLQMHLRSIAQTVEQFNTWHSLAFSQPITKKWSVSAELHWRQNEGWKNPMQRMARLNLGHVFPSKVRAEVGYSFFVNAIYGKLPAALSLLEHRPHQQLMLPHQFGRFGLQHRYRLEQRFIKKAALNATGQKEHLGFDLRHRVRYRPMLTIPINSQKMEKGTVFASLYDELLVSFGKNTEGLFIDQHRYYFGAGWRCSEAMTLQLGYMNQRIYKPDGLRREYNHTLMVIVQYVAYSK